MNAFRQNDVAAHPIVALEPLEDRQLLALPWAYWLVQTGAVNVFEQYPWLNGGGNNVAVIDKGIDYWHPALGGNQAKGIKSPFIVNVYDFRDHNTDPFPKESELTDPSSAHGTGVAGILRAKEGDYNGRHFKGLLQNSLIYNLRTDRFNSQTTIKQALDWVVANHAKYHITAINLTDFVGTGSPTAIYADEVKALWDAGVFIATPVANDWQDPVFPHYPIGLPAKDPYIFGVGGVLMNGQINPKTQRGPGLDILGPSERVLLPYYQPSTGTHFWTDFGTGNSWATPHVVATAVMMQQIDPTITPAQIMQIMQSSGIPVSDPDHTGSYVRLDIYNAIRTTYQVRDDVFGRGAGNHTMRTAAGLRFRRGSATFTGMKLLIGAPDWYQFTISKPGTMAVGVGYDTPGQSATAQVFDSQGRSVGVLGRRGLAVALHAGTYFINVSRPTSLVGTYSVTASAVVPRVRRAVSGRTLSLRSVAPAIPAVAPALPAVAPPSLFNTSAIREASWLATPA